MEDILHKYTTPIYFCPSINPFVCITISLLYFSFNSSPPSAAYMGQWIGSALVQIMVCRLFGTKPLPEPMLGYCQLDMSCHGNTFHIIDPLWGVVSGFPPQKTNDIVFSLLLNGMSFWTNSQCASDLRCCDTPVMYQWWIASYIVTYTFGLQYLSAYLSIPASVKKLKWCIYAV